MTTENDFKIILPASGKGYKELESLRKRRNQQVLKVIDKLRKNPTNFQDKNIEKLKVHSFGDYSIRVSGGDRIFYDVDLKTKKVYLLRASKHDIYKRL